MRINSFSTIISLDLTPADFQRTLQHNFNNCGKTNSIKRKLRIVTSAINIRLFFNSISLLIFTCFGDIMDFSHANVFFILQSNCFRMTFLMKVYVIAVRWMDIKRFQFYFEEKSFQFRLIANSQFSNLFWLFKGSWTIPSL